MAPTRLPIGPLLLLTLTALSVACSPGDDSAPEGLIDRAAFIDAYVDLRISALGEESGEISDAGRAAVLQRHSLREDDLLDFAEGHGRDLDFMRDVWNEIEQRLDVERPAEDPGQ